MKLQINIINSETPIYQQIYDQVKMQIIQGEISSGEMLPSIRTLAKELRISVITVKKAWEELEHDGLIFTQAGRGCFVAQLTSQDRDDRKDRLLEEKLRADIAYYHQYGLSCKEVIDLFNKYWDD